MKKINIVFLFVGLFVLAVVVAGCGGKRQAAEKATAEPQQKIVLKVAYPFPASNLHVIHGIQYWMNCVEEKLGKEKIQFNVYPAEQLGKAKDLLDLVRMGTADIIYIVPSHVEGKLPLSGVTEIPGICPDIETGAKAAYKIARGILLEQEYKKHNVQPLFTLLGPPSQVQTIKKPINKIMDIKGLKLRTPGGIAEQAFTLLGASPVSMPAMELFEALQRGTLDGCYLPYTSLPAYKIEEIANFGTVDAPFGTVYILALINEKTWQGLNAEVQDIFLKAAEETMKHYPKKMSEEEQRIIKLCESKGMSTHYFTLEEKKELTELLKSLADQWVKSMEEKGLSGKKVLEEYRKAIQESQ